ncbi:MAG: hypothetical protein QM315_09960 [Bacillota bacterium]|jgi:uncharacterized membrane protein YkvI|nr:hypothetical protein [Bacillota bacterium]
MKTQPRNILKIAGVYVASTIGAAFASGQEIIKFFTRFDLKGYPGVIAAGILFSIAAIASLDIVYLYKVNSSRELLNILGGRHFGKILEFVSLIFTFCVYVVMIAGASALCHRLTGLPSYAGMLILTILSTILICFDIKGVLAASEILTPVMITGMLYIGIRIIIRSQPVFAAVINDSHKGLWFVYAVLYVCYNSILNILVIGSLRPWLTTRKTVYISGVAGGTALLTAMFVLNSALFINYHIIRDSELPMVELSVLVGKWSFIFYSLILAFALFTTALSSGYCCTERLAQITKKPRWVLNVCIGLLVIPMAKQGFSKMVGKIYPLFGWIGSFLFILMTFHWLKTLLCGMRKRN